MSNISLLDCTLRDGGYINQFQFGRQTIKDLIGKLAKASIDIIECGFLQSGAFDQDKSLYGNVEAIRWYINDKNRERMYAAMIRYGSISNEEIEPCDGTSVDSIRIAFHKHEIDGALVLGRQLIDKGYQIIMQPVSTASYGEETLLKLIARVNVLQPYAFYIVDTLGAMYKNDVLRTFQMVNHSLRQGIAIGFHSHNNLQLSFANAQELIQFDTPRQLIIDSSVCGIGRGAGNLQTELVTQYMNTHFGPRYDSVEILKIVDEYIYPLSRRYTWGYNTAYCIASVTGCHPNYATFLLNQGSLRSQDIYAILNNLSMEHRTLFDKAYISDRYQHYMARD